ncbi:MAG: glycosyltransferase, partial [Gammaproteobacteria bacterium]|nr:glycosyltransferase [Gammaproteobacteria bacterium]
QTEKIIVQTPSSLISLLQPLYPCQWIRHDQGIPYFDYHTALFTLPLAHQTTLENIPYTTAYLRANEKQIAIWKNRFASLSKPKIGLVWRGSAEHANDYLRSIDLTRLLEALPTEFDYISLQKEPTEEDLAVLEKNPQIYQCQNMIEDFSDTAAICQCLDLLICVDTSVTHLAGALGVPTWVLLATDCDWRWGKKGDVSPWYQSIKLFRQLKTNQWDTVLDKLQRCLSQGILMQDTPT